MNRSLIARNSAAGVIASLALFTVMATGFSVTAFGQEARSSELFKTMKAMDARLFGEGFNQCNIEVFKELLSGKVEFFHDVSGVSESKDQFIEVIRIGLCKDGKPVVKRILDEDSVEVFSMRSDGKLYGAIQSGVHYFGDQGQARFIHLWLLEGGEWRLARVLSFDHKEIVKE